MRIYRYWIYVLTNPGRSVLYIGFTGDLSKRLTQHRDAADLQDFNKFSGRYNCRHLLYFEEYQWAHEAIAREKELKKLSRGKKFSLIRNVNPGLEFLESGWI